MHLLLCIYGIDLELDLIKTFKQHSDLVSNSRTIDINVQLSFNSHIADTSLLLLLLLRVQKN